MKSRIQIIDDNVPLTTLLAKALAKFGYEPVVENNPLLAINTVRHYMPDLILLDVMMPERDGGRVLADLRNDLSLRYIPVVLLTAIAREAQTLASTGGIRSQVLSKPVQLQELVRVIEEELKANMTYQQLQSSGKHLLPQSPAPTPFEAPPMLGLGDETPQDSEQGTPGMFTMPLSIDFSQQFPARNANDSGSLFGFPGRDDDMLPG
ncbi:MAG TPA: response regulator [Bacteroidia bacterium]|nr:response regulator [Bacteroidia bacterium]